VALPAAELHPSGLLNVTRSALGQGNARSFGQIQFSGIPDTDATALALQTVAIVVRPEAKQSRMQVVLYSHSSGNPLLLPSSGKEIIAEGNCAAFLERSITQHTLDNDFSSGYMDISDNNYEKWRLGNLASISARQEAEKEKSRKRRGDLASCA